MAPPPASPAAPLVPALGASPAWLQPQQRIFGAPVIETEVNGEVTGRFPMSLTRSRYGFPFPLLQSWQTPLTFAGTPFIRKDRAEATLEALLRRPGAGAFLFTAVPATGPFWDSLSHVAGRLGAPVHVARRWQRAALRPAGTFEQWFEANFERKRRKEYRRLRTRLGETGDLKFHALGQDGDLKAWLDEFVVLEARGWKGRRGTAFGANPPTNAALAEALQTLCAQGNLLFWKLTLDARPIAMMFAMVEGDMAWLGKIAFDEEFARFSPGVLLVLSATEALFADPRVAVVDSCAIPDHPMINHIWRDRLEMCDVLVGKAGMSRAKFAIIARAEDFRHASREKLKDWYYWLRQRRRS